MEGSIGVVIGKRLRARRRLLGLTQAEVAAACGVTFQQIQKYECALTQLSVPMLWRLADALGARVGYFFDGLEAADGEAASRDGFGLRSFAPAEPPRLASQPRELTRQQ